MEAVTAVKTWSCKEYNGLRVDKIEGLYEKYVQELIIKFANVQEISIVTLIVRVTQQMFLNGQTYCEVTVFNRVDSL